MFVGVAVVTLRLMGTRSLKDKRGLLSSLLSRARQRFNVAIAEVGAQDSHRTAVLGYSCVANESAHAEEQISVVLHFIEAHVLGLAEVVDCQTEVLSGFAD